jgi:carnitine-CoA ligase
VSLEWSDWYRRADPTGWVLPKILRERAAADPDRDYLRFGDGPWLSYGEVNRRANVVANALRALGLQPGEAVSTMLPNCEDHLPLWFGILKAGGVQSPINTAYRGDFLSWVLNLPRSRFLVVAGQYLDRVEEIAGELTSLESVVVWTPEMSTGALPPGLRCRSHAELLADENSAEPAVEVGWTDDARIMFTSGTTGRSKGVIKQHASDYFSGRTYNEVCGVTSDDTFFSCLPLFHSNAQVLGAYPAMIAGARIALVERYSSSNFWRQVIDAEATILNTVSAMNYFIWNTPPSEHDRAHRVRRIMAMPAPKDIYDKFKERFGIRFHEGYGLTETGMVTYVPPGEERPGSCGKATPGFEVFVVEPGTDRPVAPGVQGEIVVDMKLPNIVMRAYAGMPEKTAEDFSNLKLHTGDLGEMDAEGYLYFRDRLKDYIRRRGENVSSMEVEAVARKFAGVEEAAAIGIKSGDGAGAEDEILLCVVPSAGATVDPEALVGFMSAKMPYFAVPRFVRLMPSLPKTPTERVRKVELREEGITADTWERLA